MNTFKEYHDSVHRLAEYPDHGSNLIYPALGLVGESGELAEKIKKLWRNYGITGKNSVNLLRDLAAVQNLKEGAIREMGDVLWYLDALATEFGTTLDEVARMNSEKVNDRNKRNVIKSEGDNR